MSVFIPMGGRPVRRRGTVLLFVLLLAAPLLLLRATGPSRDADTGDGSAASIREAKLERDLDRLEIVEPWRLRLPPSTPRPPEFAPLGAMRLRPRLEPRPTGRHILTNLGHLDIEDPEMLYRGVPAHLLLPDGRLVDTPRGRLALPGLNYVKIAPGAARARPLEEILRPIREIGRIVDFLPSSTLLLELDDGARDLVARVTDIEFVHPVHPANKLSLDLGARPLIERKRATDPELLLDVSIVPRPDGRAVRDRLAAIPGVRDVLEYPFDAATFRVRAHHTAVPAIARVPEVRWVQEAYEFWLSNAESAIVVQVGSRQDARNIRPFDEAGVDGGGIDTNGDGRRINNGSDAVPPQIVAVIDNGISVDQPGFSHTATQSTIPIFAPIGPSHRKVHALHNVDDPALATCDAHLSGSSTHGNLVASTIAAHPSEVGAFASQAGIGPIGVARGAKLDGVARGARILMQDAADPSRCSISTFRSMGGNVNPGNLLERMNEIICPRGGGQGPCAGIVGGGTEVHLAVLPFGAPVNFSELQFEGTRGTYPKEAEDLDRFMYNNRDFLIVSPVGNNGGFVTDRVYPDLFDGTALDDDPNAPRPIQISPPATAKNVVSTGWSISEVFQFGNDADTENVGFESSSRGPATPQSLRMAPILMAPGGLDAPPAQREGFGSVATFRSRDNDNSDPVVAQVVEYGLGTSLSAGYLAGAAAIVRDYFAQGFYPGGDRAEGDRVPDISGALVKAALVASANFLEGLRVSGSSGALSERDRHLRRTRGMNLGTVAGVPVGVMGNSDQGYGRVVLTQVLPLSSWSDAFVMNPTSPFRAPESPASALLAWDDMATGEPLLNDSNPIATHSFRVDGPDRVVTESGGVAIAGAQLRVALAWTDPPSPAGSGGPLVNDLDLILESPGPDGDIATSQDNTFYDGNVYAGGNEDPVTDQWSLARTGPAGEIHDLRNPQEAIHLTADPSRDGSFADSPLFVGTWRVTVRVGGGGATPGRITLTGGAVDEDTDGDRRLDPGEDVNGNGLLDLPGQAYALVVAGPVFLAEASPTKGPALFPQSRISFDRIEYSCADEAIVVLFDSTPGAGPDRSEGATVFTVVDASGAIVDEESNLPFMAGTAPGGTRSRAVPVRLAAPAMRHNGILEADTGQAIAATYAPAGQRTVTARARVDCSPDLVPGFFATGNAREAGPQVIVARGCDDDGSFDAGETVTYGVALANRSTTDDYTDVVATLTPSGPGAAALRVLDSPRDLGRLPPSSVNSVFFHVFVDPARIPVDPADRRATMTLSLDARSGGLRIDRQDYSFTHPIDSDPERLHYSTDFPDGGRSVRDLNRNLFIDRPDALDPFHLIVLPDESITFSSLFVPGDGAGRITNTLGEDLNGNGLLDPGEDLILNGALDGGILVSPDPAAPHAVPWNFDRGPGGWVPFRHPHSRSGNLGGNPVWEHETLGLCGFQTSIPDPDPGALFQNGGAGIWHTGDGNPDTPSRISTACDNHARPSDGSTPPLTEAISDQLHSPIIAKVNQAADARGFPYTVEFQRLGLNINIQFVDGYAQAALEVDNDLDSDDIACLLCSYRLGGPIYLIDPSRYSFPPGFTGVDPSTTAPPQRTFGPFLNPDGSAHLDGDETGFTGETQDTNPNSTSPIPEAPPDLLPHPLPGAPAPGACAGGTTPGAPCQTGADCPGPGMCELADRTVAGPVRNLDFTLIGLEEGFAGILDVTAGTDRPIFGAGGNRWGIGIRFFAQESTSGITDYGLGVDDVVFEWDEVHPLDESEFDDGRGPACTRFNGPGLPAGGQCASITVDRTVLYDCEESIDITVFDPKRPNDPSIEVTIVTDSDSVRFATQRFSVLTPNAKRYVLPAVPGVAGLFRAAVAVSTVSNTRTNVFTAPGTDSRFRVDYVDPLCDGDGDGTIGENDFDNIDGDGIPFAIDNCPLAFNPDQEDGDGDGAGDLCDTCPLIPDPGQGDADADHVGDACEFDDVDGDGTENGFDNCPDLYNPDQVEQIPGRGVACDSPNGDLDADGIVDRNDNCVLAANPTQADRDLDRLGDACDGDCEGSLLVFLCSNDPATSCSGDPDCPAGGICQSAARHAGGSCSAVDDDADADGVEDAVDACPTIPDPPIIAGTKRQADADRDGLGDVCDPAGSLDDDLNGLPDDLVTFDGRIECSRLPLASFVLLSTAYRDLDGDNDPFPDTGETGRVTVTLLNSGPSLTGVTFHLSTSDPGVACITQGAIAAGAVPSGTVVDVGTLQAGEPGFTFVASETLESSPSGPPARVELCLGVTANETLGTASPLCFELLADLDIPPGVRQVFTRGPDGIPDTADDGITFESFDTDKSGNGIMDIGDTFLQAVGDGGSTTYGGPPGFYMRGSATGATVNTMAGVPCGGFDTPASGNEACVLDPDFPFDWHFHCPSDATNCPNTDVLPGDGAPRTCVGGCSYGTPVGNALAISPPNSLHMGAHFDLTSEAGNTTHLRALQAFVTPPINLALLPRSGDLEMSFFHIADLMDNNSFNLPDGLCADCADVQVQVDLDPDPAVDDWGFWDKLAPFENVYDHQPDGGSFGYYNCLFTPADTGFAPPAPRGVHETICSPLGAWSTCGNDGGSAATDVRGCAGPGFVDPSGTGVWVQSRFDLSLFQGQRIRIRWIGASWVFGANVSSYYEYGGGWERATRDDGWWLDDITVTGTIEDPLTPTPDSRPSPGGGCPAAGCDPSVGDNGTLVVVEAKDLGGATLDGVNAVAVSGQAIRITAIESTLPGGCTDGAPQYRFLRDGATAQDFSSKTFLQDWPRRDTIYTVKARCSSDFTCTSASGASLPVQVYPGDGSDVRLTAEHDQASGVTTLRWTARPQPPPMSGYDLFQGSIPPPDAPLGTLAPLLCDTGAGAPPGAVLSATTSATPAVGSIHYYLAGHGNPAAGARTLLGRRSDGTLRLAPTGCP